MKLRTMAFVMILVAAFAASAVAGAGARTHAATARAEADAQAMELPRLAKVLGLSQEQVVQIKDILQRFHADARALMQSNTPPAEKRTKMMGLKQAAGNAIMALLTPEQQQKAKRMNLIERLLSPGRAARGLLWALQQLNLTDQQKADIKAIMQDTEAKAKAIRQDATMTPEQKQTQLQTLHKASMDSIVALLTPEQKQKLRELMAEEPRRGRQ